MITFVRFVALDKSKRYCKKIGKYASAQCVVAGEGREVGENDAVDSFVKHLSNCESRNLVDRYNVRVSVGISLLSRRLFTT